MTGANLQQPPLACKGTTMEGNMASAEVIPFPVLKRVDLFDRHADYIANMNPPKRGPNIERLVQNQVDKMRQRGIADDLIEREITNCRRALAVHLQQALQNYDDGDVA
jgi:hypothetical protein